MRGRGGVRRQPSGEPLAAPHTPSPARTPEGGWGGEKETVSKGKGEEGGRVGGRRILTQERKTVFEREMESPSAKERMSF